MPATARATAVTMDPTTRRVTFHLEVPTPTGEVLPVDFPLLLAEPEEPTRREDDEVAVKAREAGVAAYRSGTYPDFHSAVSAYFQAGTGVLTVEELVMLDAGAFSIGWAVAARESAMPLHRVLHLLADYLGAQDDSGARATVGVRLQYDLHAYMAGRAGDDLSCQLASATFAIVHGVTPEEALSNLGLTDF